MMICCSAVINDDSPASKAAADKVPLLLIQLLLNAILSASYDINASTGPGWLLLPLLLLLLLPLPTASLSACAVFPLQGSPAALAADPLTLGLNPKPAADL